MRRIILGLMLASLPVMVGAQQPAAPSPQIQALQQTVIELTGEKLDWRARVIADEATIADLRKQLDEAKTPKPGSEKK